MTLLFVQHVDNEGPGIFEDVLDEMGISFHVVEIFSHKSFSLSSDCRGVIILGGPMNVDEESKYPFVKEEKKFIGNLLNKEIPLSGICLGAQLIAQTAGGEVFKTAKKEIGWYPIRLTEEGVHDSLFQGCPSPSKYFSGMRTPSRYPLRGKDLLPQMVATIRASR